jgi:hypothetical protein
LDVITAKNYGKTCYDYVNWMLTREYI